MKPHLQLCDRTEIEEEKYPSVLEENGPCGGLENPFGHFTVRQEKQLLLYLSGKDF